MLYTLRYSEIHLPPPHHHINCTIFQFYDLLNWCTMHHVQLCFSEDQRQLYLCVVFFLTAHLLMIGAAFTKSRLGVYYNRPKKTER